MNTSIIFGLFALYVAAISLFLVLAGHQDVLLALLRRCWGRTRGHILYFLGYVALPVLIGVICLGWGVRQYDPRLAFETFTSPLHLDVEPFRNARLMHENQPDPDPFGVIYGA